VNDTKYFIFNFRQTDSSVILGKINQYYILNLGQQFEIMAVNRLYKFMTFGLYEIFIELKKFVAFDINYKCRMGINVPVQNRICGRREVHTEDPIFLNKYATDIGLAFKYLPYYTISNVIDNSDKLYICVVRNNTVYKIKNNDIMVCINDLGECALPHINLNTIYNVDKNIEPSTIHKIDLRHIIRPLFPLHCLDDDILQIYKLNYIYLYVNYLAIVYIDNSSLLTLNKKLFPDNSKKNIKWITSNGNVPDNLLLTCNVTLVINEIKKILSKNIFWLI